MTSRILTKLLAVGAIAATAGCGTLRPDAWTPVKRLQTGGSEATRADGYYADATAAILDLDYGRALDLLQLARRDHERDARILNAFGVVYDKLGRFDLSARYYAQALAIDPGSEIVKGNLAYSQALQQTWRSQSSPPSLTVAQPARDPTTLATAAPAARPLAPPPPAPVEPITPQLARANAIEPAPATREVVERPLVYAAADVAGLVRTAWPTAIVPPRSAAPSPEPLPGGPRPYAVAFGDIADNLPAPPRASAPRPGSLVLLDASGQADRVHSLRMRLRHLGWSPGGPVSPLAAASPRTTIRYPDKRARIARALARTLPVPAQLETCGRACNFILVTFGTDVSRPRYAAIGSTATGGR